MVDPVVWLIGAVAGLAGFTAWMIRWALAHLESDLAYSREVAKRGVEVAEKGADLVERTR